MSPVTVISCNGDPSSITNAYPVPSRSSSKGRHRDTSKSVQIKPTSPQCVSTQSLPSLSPLPAVPSSGKLVKMPNLPGEEAQYRMALVPDLKTIMKAANMMSESSNKQKNLRLSSVIANASISTSKKNLLIQELFLSDDENDETPADVDPIMDDAARRMATHGISSAIDFNDVRHLRRFHDALKRVYYPNGKLNPIVVATTDQDAYEGDAEDDEDDYTDKPNGKPKRAKLKNFSQVP